MNQALAEPVHAEALPTKWSSVPAVRGNLARLTYLMHDIRVRATERRDQLAKNPS